MPALGGPDALTLRESWLKGTLTKKKAKLVPQQLFKKNTYQFWFAVPDPEVEVLINIYDGEGKKLTADTEKFSDSRNVVSLKITPEKSGIHYLRLAITNTNTAHDWALIYAWR